MTLADRLRDALARIPPKTDELRGDAIDHDPARKLAAAAVLVPVVDRPMPTVLLTRRHDGLRNHAGQVAFPGGRVDPGDAGVEAAALREAWEEVALAPGAVEIVGRGDRYVTATGYSISPVIGVIAPDLPLRAHEVEVADIFEVPLHHLLDPTMHVSQEALFHGRQRPYYEITVDGWRIWGVTAGIIVDLSKRLTDW
jgi:8-oxo-dGTP pyrophosphatase MutT (NUDIX family)